MLGITPKFYDAQFNLESQIAASRDFVQDPDVDVLVLAALEPTGWDDLLKEAQAAGKVVILEDLRINAPEDLYATRVGSDFVEEGRKAAVEMCRLLEGSGKKNVWELAGSAEGPYAHVAQERGQGFREKMSECGITITQSKTANWDVTEGTAVMEAWLQRSTDIQGVFAQDDNMALGAIQAIKEAGLNPGSGIKIVSIGPPIRGAFEAMIAGDLNTVIECNPLLAPQVYEAALRALNGETLPKWLPSAEGVYYSENARRILETPPHPHY